MFHLKGWLAIVLMALSVESSWAAGSYVPERSTDKAKNRWTLQEWLEQRDRNRMMDLWLTFNSPSPYEGMVGAAYKSYLREVDPTKTQTSYTSGDGSITLHASIIGLTVDYENNPQESYNDLSGMLNLRVFGNSIQSTSITLHGGQRTRTSTVSTPSTVYKNQFAQASLQLYLMKYFGIDGFYRYYVPNEETALQKEVRGSLMEAGAFIDFKTIRIFGSYYQDLEITKSTVSPYDEVTTKRSGGKAGLKLYF